MPASLRVRAWLLAPVASGIVAFASTFGVIAVTGTNRTDLDQVLGLFGFGAFALGLAAFVAALIVHPWRSGSERDWLLLLLHPILLFAILLVAGAWVGAHLA